MGCAEDRQKPAAGASQASVQMSIEEAYVAYKQVSLKLHLLPCDKAIAAVKMHSRNGSLTTNTFARILISLGLIKLAEPKSEAAGEPPKIQPASVECSTAPPEDSKVVKLADPAKPGEEKKEETVVAPVKEASAAPTQVQSQLSPQIIIDKERLKQDKRWAKFYGCLSDYRDETGNTFNTLNIVMSLILLANGTHEEKVRRLYENLDWECKGKVDRSMVRVFVKNFCVVSGQVLPYFAEDIYDNPVNLKSTESLLAFAVAKMPDKLTEKVMRGRQDLSKEDFVAVFASTKYKYLFDSVMLRRRMVEKYKAKFERKQRALPKSPRLSIPPEDFGEHVVVTEAKNPDELKDSPKGEAEGKAEVNTPEKKPDETVKQQS